MVVKPEKDLGLKARVRELEIMFFVHKQDNYITLLDVINAINDINYNQAFVALRDLFSIGYIEVGKDENSDKYKITFEGKQYVNWRKSALHIIGF